jgi:hypothetical protein
MRFKQGCFCPKNGAILQKNGGPTEIILHFFLWFSGLFLFSGSQAVDLQPPTPALFFQKNHT